MKGWDREVDVQGNDVPFDWLRLSDFVDAYLVQGGVCDLKEMKEGLPFEVILPFNPERVLVKNPISTQELRIHLICTSNSLTSLHVLTHLHSLFLGPIILWIRSAGIVVGLTFVITVIFDAYQFIETSP